MTYLFVNVAYWNCWPIPYVDQVWWWYVKAFMSYAWQNWQTDRHTDRQTDKRPYLQISSKFWQVTKGHSYIYCVGSCNCWIFPLYNHGIHLGPVEYILIRSNWHQTWSILIRTYYTIQLSWGVKHEMPLVNMWIQWFYRINNKETITTAAVLCVTYPALPSKFCIISPLWGKSTGDFTVHVITYPCLD